MGTQYHCKNEGRRQAVARQKTSKINGIDYLEVEDNEENGKSILKVHFILDIVVGNPPKNNIVIKGVDGSGNVEVENAETDHDKNVLVVTVNTPEKNSTDYTLHITKSKDDPSPPDGFNPQLSHVMFRFRDKGKWPAVINGIDYLEIEDEVEEYKGKTILNVYFIFNLNIDLNKSNVVIEGGVRVKNVEIENAKVDKNVLVVIVNSLGDFSKYTLRITGSKTDFSPPNGFDPQLSHIDFSFKVKCPSEFDCKSERECPPEKLPEPEIDYLAKDYDSFRRLMLDRLSIIMPDWKERSPADLQVALVEMLAYVGDNLSYFQDAVATEAYLGTARKRISIRRHARLLDYFMHEGCNARAWVCLEVDKDMSISLKNTVLLTQGSDNDVMVNPDNLKSILNDDVTVFETIYDVNEPEHDVNLYSNHNCIRFYTWDNTECCLPRGSTKATLLEEKNKILSLKFGDVLIFEEICSPTTGKKEDTDVSHRHAVRLKTVSEGKKDKLNGTKIVDIEWDEADALPFPLCISAIIKSDEGAQIHDIAVARGNVVLVDHGHTITTTLKPAEVPKAGLYRPRLPEGPLTYREEFDFKTNLNRPAVSAMKREIRKALPAIKLESTDKSMEKIGWSPRYDLLSSERFSTEFTVENELDGISYLRFGDDAMGKKPTDGSSFEATYRTGNGKAGNVGSEAISRIVMKGEGIIKVRNPLPSAGGTDPEPAELVRLYAPQAFRTQERAVTEADYAEITERHAGVQKAMATIRWTGSWYTVFVTIDRKGGREVDADFKEDILNHLEKYRLAGYDVEINRPIYVPLEITMKICVKPRYFRSDVKQSLLKAFSNQELVNGRHGFFHPDNFTFNQPLYLSRIYETAMDVAGVASVEVTQFRRWGKLSAGELDEGAMMPGTLEILRLDNDPNFPENGKISFNMESGL